MSYKKIYIAVGVGIIICIIFAAFVSYSMKEAFYWQDDRVVSYDITYREILHNTPHQGTGFTSDYFMKGKLNLKIFQVTEKTIKAGIRFYPLTVKSSGSEEKELSDLYSQFFLAEFAPDGALIKTYFNNAIAEEDGDNLTSILKAYQFILRKTITGAWEHHDFDETGRCLTKYNRNKNHYIKRKIRYNNINYREGLTDDNLRAEVNRSEFRFSPGIDQIWLKEAEGAERITLYSEDKKVLTISLAISLKISDYADEIFFTKENSFDDILHQWESEPRNRISYRTKKLIKALSKEYDWTNIDALARSIFRKYKKFDYNGVIPLVEYLKINPEAATLFPGIILSGNFSEQQNAMLVHSLERSGSVQAQSALTSILSDKDFPRPQRVQAVIAFCSIIRPSDEAVSALWSIYSSRDSRDEVSEEVSTTALLALGAISRRKGESDDDNDRSQSAVLRDRILTELSACPESDVKKKTALYTAAGNTGSDKSYRVVEKGFSSKNPIIRSSAVNALKNIDTEKVNNRLCEHLSDEKDPVVREAVIRSLYKRESDLETTSFLIRYAGTEGDENVRSGIYRYLTKNRHYPGVKDKMNLLLQTEKSLRNRKLLINGVNAD